MHVISYNSNSGRQKGQKCTSIGQAVTFKDTNTVSDRHGHVAVGQWDKLASNV
jgi:hypothetical protein